MRIALIADGAPIPALELPAVWVTLTGDRPAGRPARTALRGRVSRAVIARQLGVPLEAVDIGHEARGRPLITLPATQGLRMSHATRGGVVATALAQVAVGVDIEKGDAEAPEGVLHPAEEQWLATAAPGAFAELWAAKEAYVKWLGTGLMHAPDGFALLPAAGDGRWRLDDPALAGEAPAILTRRVTCAGADFAVALAFG